MPLFAFLPITQWKTGHLSAPGMVQAAAKQQCCIPLNQVCSMPFLLCISIIVKRGLEHRSAASAFQGLPVILDRAIEVNHSCKVVRREELEQQQSDVCCDLKETDESRQS